MSGDWVMRCEARTLDDIRALGGNDAEDERRFATAARVSETNLALYRTYHAAVRAGAVANPHDGRMDAPHASAAAAIRDVLGRQSVHGAGQGGRGARCAPSASRSRPTIRSWRCRRRCPSQIVAWLRRLAGRHEKLVRADLPVDLRLAGVAGACRHRSGIERASLRKAGKNPLHRQFVEHADRRTAVADRRRAGSAKRMVRAAALCRHGARLRGRARLRADPPDAACHDRDVSG